MPAAAVGGALGVAALLCFTVPGQAAQTDQEEIRQVFDSYKAALVGGDGALAASLVDAATVDYFVELRQLALSGEEAAVRAQSFIDRLLIVSIRHVMDAETIRGLELSDLIERAMTEGWIGGDTISQLVMGAVTIEGDLATGEVLTSSSLTDAGSPSAVEDLSYQFVRERGRWRFRFSSLVEGLNELIRRFAELLGAEEDTLIFTLVENFSGRKVLPEVWKLAPGNADQNP